MRPLREAVVVLLMGMTMTVLYPTLFLLMFDRCTG